MKAPSGNGGTITKIGPADIEVKYKEKPYTVRVPNKEMTSMVLELVLDGTYEDFQRFLRSMNRFPKLVKVNEVGISPAQQGTSLLRFRVNTRLFFLSEEVEKVLAEAKTPVVSAGSGGVSVGGSSVVGVRPQTAGASAAGTPALGN